MKFGKNHQLICIKDETEFQSFCEMNFNLETGQ